MTVGASDAVYIQSGDWAKLWDIKQATTRPQMGLAARIGIECEPLNRAMFTEQTGLELIYSLTWHESPFQLKGEEWYTYLPDGLLKDTSDESDIIVGPNVVNVRKTELQEENRFIPFEGKAINGMWQPHLLLKKYMPQLQHAMRVLDAPYAYFSVIYLNTKWEQQKILYDEPYADALFEKEKLFHWFQTENKRPPEWAGKRKGWI